MSGENTPTAARIPVVMSAAPATVTRARADARANRPSARKNPSCWISSHTSARFAYPTASIPVLRRMMSTASTPAASAMTVSPGRRSCAARSAGRRACTSRKTPRNHRGCEIRNPASTTSSDGTPSARREARPSAVTATATMPGGRRRRMRFAANPAAVPPAPRQRRNATAPVTPPAMKNSGMIWTSHEAGQNQGCSSALTRATSPPETTTPAIVAWRATTTIVQTARSRSMLVSRAGAGAVMGVLPVSEHRKDMPTIHPLASPAGVIRPPTAG